VSGDFCQILPVIPNGTHASITQACVKASQLWTQLTTLHLTQNMCITKVLQQYNSEHDQQHLLEFDQWLKQIGEGTAPGIFDNIIKLDSTIVASTPDDVINFVYNDFQLNLDNSAYFKEFVLLASQIKLSISPMNNCYKK